MSRNINLRQATVAGGILNSSGGGAVKKWLGFWVQIQVPVALAGKELTLQPAVVQKRIFSKDALEDTSYGFYVQFLKGNWVAPTCPAMRLAEPQSRGKPAPTLG
ncbi:hypothetical protein [Pseudomonas sp. H9]|uniref:hypothetical protein n=1 Tax=Pseudomonas sp. H9 TaxID=483968 RepID=UPI0010581D29|nr:hypothetical protein [Pseudomonas sp. H9]TDF84437.1 hypothetical protein E1573_07870 [Pseudomonas sp. H9]